MFQKIKAFVKQNRYACSASLMSALVMCSAFAAEGDSAASFDLTSVMTTSVTKIVNDLLSMITAVLPTAIILFSASIGITYSISFIKGLMNRSKTST